MVESASSRSRAESGRNRIGVGALFGAARRLSSQANSARGVSETSCCNQKCDQLLYSRVRPIVVFKSLFGVVKNRATEQGCTKW